MTTRGWRAPRGQNLVLLALTMLFLVLMVTMTLGLGLRIRQKHELQNLADAAAYSNAVVEARAFNNAALINRLEVSHWVAMAADESLISWTGYSRGMAVGARRAVWDAFRGCNDRAQQDALLNTWVGLVLYSFNEYRGSDWNDMDEAAGKEALAIQGTIAGLRNELGASVSGAPANETLMQRLERYQKDQLITQQVLRASGLPRDEVSPVPRPDDPPQPGSVTGLNRREVDCDFGSTVNGPLEGSDPPNAGLCMRGTWNRNMLQAAMGSRGNTFVTGRGQVPSRTQTDLTAIGAARGTVITFGGVTGSGYWSVGREKHGSDPDSTEAWADDHGSVTVATRDCFGSDDMKAHVKSTHIDDDDDSHGWNTDDDDRGTADDRHTMGSCQPLCPSVWVRTLGFQPNDTAADAYGQPKVTVALERNLAFRPFPWELNFSFPFSATGTAREWDGRGQQLRSGPAPGLDISKQVAWSTGIVYYHRFEHWNEFPNLLNPFWRATLAPADVDLQGRTDVVNALTGTHRWQGQAYDELVKAGFKGLH